MFIIKTPRTYDVEKIAADVRQAMLKVRSGNHINISKRPGDDDNAALTFRADSLYDRNLGKYIHSESEWKEINPLFRSTYLEHVYDDVCKYAYESYKLKIGRARINILPGKQCLTLHKDLMEEVRFHVPVNTNKGALFINNDQVGRMEEEGALYVYKTSMLHTAINASREMRVHLVFSTYKE